MRWLELTCFIALACRGSSRELDHLVLHEISSTTLGSALILGTASAPDGTVLVWGPHHYFAVIRANGKTSVLPVTKDVLGAAWVSPDVVQIVFERTLAEFSKQDGVFREVKINTPLPIVQAIRTEDGWFVGLESTTGDFELHQLVNGNSSRLVARVVPRGGESLVANWVQLARLSHGVGLTRRLWPFESRLFYREPNRMLLIGPDTGVIGPLIRSNHRRSTTWASLPLFEFQGGFLQTLADLASDERLILWYDKTGALRQARSVSVPMGLVGQAKEDSVLIALRRTNALELVRYAWSVGIE
jgi:hypothetical protein